VSALPSAEAKHESIAIVHGFCKCIAHGERQGVADDELRRPLTEAL
jgi:hypothetical protein